MFFVERNCVSLYHRKPTSSILPTSHSDIGIPSAAKRSDVGVIPIYDVHVLIIHDKSTPQYCVGEMYIRHGFYQLVADAFFTPIEIELDSLVVESLDHKLKIGIGTSHVYTDDQGQLHHARIMIFDTSEHAMHWQTEFLRPTT